ncbi:MAG: hypothetical protein ACI8RN_002801 [Glaciecola sp.]|jgi:hypothetical protein
MSIGYADGKVIMVREDSAGGTTDAVKKDYRGTMV